MNLVEVYVYEVTKRLPEKSRDDIALELKSTIEDMLPENHTEVEVNEALTKMGDPAVLAASYRDKPMHLIGPRVYDAYIRTMKLTIPWAVFITVLVHVVESIVAFSGQEAVLMAVAKSFGMIIGDVIWVLTQVFFWMTIVFAVIERVGLPKEEDVPLTKYGTKWTPEQLRDVVMIPRKKAITKGEVVFGFVWTAIWAIVYFNADHLAGVYRTVEGVGLQLTMPVFNQETLLSYTPIIILFIALELGLSLYKWRKGQWDMKLATVNAIIHLVSAVAFIVIASDPNLLNEAFIPYMTETIKSTSAVVETMEWIWWITVISVVASILYEIFDSFRKAAVRS